MTLENASVGNKYERRDGAVFKLVHIGHTEVALESLTEGFIIGALLADFRHNYKDYVEPKKTIKVKVADYYQPRSGSLNSFQVKTFSVKSMERIESWRLVIGSERTIEINEE